MTLPPELGRQFKEALEADEEERKVPLITSTEEMAKAERIQEGIEKRMIARISGLTLEQIDALRSETLEEKSDTRAVFD